MNHRRRSAAPRENVRVTAGTPTTYTELRSFEPRLGRVSPWASSGTRAEYYHADLIGTTRVTSDRLGGAFCVLCRVAWDEPRVAIGSRRRSGGPTR